MTRTRQPAKSSYLDYPATFPEFLEQFRLTEHVIIGPLPRNALIAYQLQLGRFFSFLRRAPPDDERARDLLEIAETIQFSQTGTPDCCYLDAHLDPFTLWKREHTPTMQPYRKGSGG